MVVGAAPQRLQRRLSCDFLVRVAGPAFSSVDFGSQTCSLNRYTKQVSPFTRLGRHDPRDPGMHPSKFWGRPHLFTTCAGPSVTPLRPSSNAPTRGALHNTRPLNYIIMPHAAVSAPSSSARAPVAARAAPARAPALRLAFAAMLCKTDHGDSTYDRPDGGGSELGALAHGYALRALHSGGGGGAPGAAASPPHHPQIDSVLLHPVQRGHCADLTHPAAMRRAYTRVIRLDGSGYAERLFLTRMRYQPHLWLKLLVLNLTEYDRVMWLGLDVIPLTSLTPGFACAA